MQTIASAGWLVMFGTGTTVTVAMDEVTLPQSTSTAQDYVVDVRNLVQTSIQNPTTSFGFMLSEINHINYYNSLIFGSSDAADYMIRPKLRICYSVATGISENEFVSLSIYPNPFADSFTIQDSGHTIESVDVFNVIGELIISKDGKEHASAITINAGQLSSGVYFARIKTDHGSVVRKLVKN